MDGQGDLPLDLADKIPDFLGGGAVSTIHITRQPNDQPDDFMGFHECGEIGNHLLDGFIFDKREGGAEGAGGIGEGEADADCAEVDSEIAAHAECTAWAIGRRKEVISGIS